LLQVVEQVVKVMVVEVEQVDLENLKVQLILTQRLH
jgi:hypothetical protein